ncbi:hypothetical protein J6590_067516 [Homalodisca vitripennis]|nr:hypothetical protein J6590_067516 [Homalodisca vitripennis]
MSLIECSPSRTRECCPSRTRECCPSRTRECCPSRTRECSPSRTRECCPSRTPGLTSNHDSLDKARRLYGTQNRCNSQGSFTAFLIYGRPPPALCSYLDLQPFTTILLFHASRSNYSIREGQLPIQETMRPLCVWEHILYHTRYVTPNAT